jgi:putative DNA primase/helicase
MPEVAPPVWDNIPAELAGRAQWLLWKFEWPEPKPGKAAPKKWAKVPYYVGGGRRAGGQGEDSDRRRLVTLAEVRRAFERKGAGWHGVGFGFLPGDGLVGIDIDGAIDPDTGEVSQRCLGIVGACRSFTEYSPSGKGCHIIGRGHVERSTKDNGIGVEMFCGGQFFTVTGRLWPGGTAELADLPSLALEGLAAMIAKAKEDRRRQQAPEASPAQPAARRAARGDRAETFDQLRARVQAALDFLSPDMNYEDWISIGWALRDAFGDEAFSMWDAWSARGSTYPGEGDLRSHWRSFKSSGKPADTVVGVIFARARDAGWKPPRRSRPAAAAAGAPPAPEEPAADAAASGGSGGSGGPPEEPPAWEGPPAEDEGPARLVLLKGKGGKPEDCRENVLYCLRHDEQLKGLVAHNQFTELQDKTRRPPWGGDRGEWTEEDDLMLGEYLARTHRLLVKGTSTIRAGVQMAARENRYHPVIDALRALQWDGTPRLEMWMVDCLGAVDRPYVRLVSRFFILGMVARLLRPGCKFDYMLILQGLQGEGKSSAFRALAEPYFMDTPFRIGDKDSYLSLQGVWLVEFSELENMSKAESTAIKAFIASMEDRFRPPYGSRMVKMPRRAVLAGTTNSDQFLKDSTGERRFWPVHVTEVRLDLLRQCRDQLFAEALHILEQKKGTEEARYYPTRAEEKELFHPEQDRWRLVDVWTDILSDYLSRETVPNDADPDDATPPIRRGFFTTQELFSRALYIKAERMDNAKLMQTRISNCMRELGFAAAREPTGARKRGYLRPGWEFADKVGLRKIAVADPAPQAQEGAPPGAPAGEGDDLPI